MSESRFRLLLALNVVCLVVAITVGFVDLLSSQPADAQAAGSATGAWLDSSFMMSLAVAYLVATAAGIVGLFWFKRWARALSLWLTLIPLSAAAFAGPALYSGADTALADLASMLWGALLAAAYWSPVSHRFEVDASRTPASVAY